MKRKSISLTVLPKEINTSLKHKHLKDYLDIDSYYALLKRFENSIDGNGNVLDFTETGEVIIKEGKLKIVIETYPNKEEISKNTSVTIKYKIGDNISYDILKGHIAKYVAKVGEEILKYNPEKDLFYCFSKRTRIIVEVNIEKHNHLFSDNKLEKFVLKETGRSKSIKQEQLDKSIKTKVEIVPSFFEKKKEEEVVVVCYEEEDEEIEML